MLIKPYVVYDEIKKGTLCIFNKLN